MARILGVDLGSRRVGLALADDADGFVVTRPALTVESTEQLLAALASMVEVDQITLVVVGLPVSLTGQDSPQTTSARSVIAQLKLRLRVPVETVDERLTTQLAHRLGRRKQDDSAAAALIVNTFLDWQKRA